jgi:hypothetical protein
MDLAVNLVCDSNEEFATSESIESIVNPFFLERIVVYLLGFTSTIDCLSKLENVVVSVEVSPHNFSVIRIITTSKALFTTIIVEGDTSCCKCKSQSTLEESLISITIKESSVIVIVNKNTKCINILEVFVILGPSIGNGTHGLSIHEDILNCEIHWIVEHCSDVVLVITNISIETIKNFTHLEDSSSLAVFSPEIFRNLGNGVYSDSIKSILSNKVTNPVLEILTYI